MTALAVLVSTLLLAVPGKPPSPEEQRLFDEGMHAFQSGDARAADRAWRAGYAVAKDPAFLVRMAEAEEKAGQLAEAGDSYRRYLRAVPDASDRAEIEQRLARLGPAAAAPAAPADAHEIPGAFGQAAPAPAAPPPPLLGEGAAPAPSPAHDDETGRRPPGGDGGDEESGWNAFNVTAWVTSGMTVLLLGTAGYYAASAASAKDDVNQLLRFQDQTSGQPLEYQTVAGRYEKAVRDGQHDDRVAKDALLAAAGMALVATAFFIVDAVRGDDARGTGDARPNHARAAGAPVLGFAVRPGGNGASAAFSALRWSF